MLFRSLANEIAARAATRGYGADPDIALAPKLSIFDSGAVAGPGGGTPAGPPAPPASGPAPAGAATPPPGGAGDAALGVSGRAASGEFGVEQSEGVTKAYEVLDEARKRMSGGTYTKPGWHGAERVTTRDGLTDEQRAAIDKLTLARQQDAVEAAAKRRDASQEQASRLAGVTKDAAKLAEDIIAPHEERLRGIDAAAKGRQELADIYGAHADRAEGEGVDANRLARNNPWAMALMGFGAALGASGAALTHSQNFAGQMMQQAIEDDIAEQRTSLAMLRQRAKTNEDAAAALRAMGPTEQARAKAALDLAKGVSEAKLKAAAAANGIDEASKEYIDALVGIHKEYFDRREKLIRDQAGTVVVKEKYNQGGFTPNGTPEQLIRLGHAYHAVGAGQETNAVRASGAGGRGGAGAGDDGMLVPDPNGGAVRVGDKVTARRLQIGAESASKGIFHSEAAARLIEADRAGVADPTGERHKKIAEHIVAAIEHQQKANKQGVLRDADAKLHAGLLETWKVNPAIVGVLREQSKSFHKGYDDEFTAVVHPEAMFPGGVSRHAAAPSVAPPPAWTPKVTRTDQPPQTGSAAAPTAAPPDPPPPTGASFAGGKWDARKDKK